MNEMIGEKTTTTVGDSWNTRLLFIEDSFVYIDAIKRAFVGDYYIYTTCSADNGLEICREFQPNVIILDINLSGNVSGLEFLRILKNNPEFAHIPVLLISGISSFEIISDGLAFGANDYMVKPLQLKHLQSKIKNLVQLCEKVHQKTINEQVIPLKEIKQTKQHLLINLNKLTDACIALKTELNIIEVAAELGVSQSTLGRFIKKEFGITTNNYLMLRKLEKAKLMMASNKYMPIKEIAISLGFSSVSYFSKCFKEQYKETPTEKHRSMHGKAVIEPSASTYDK